MLMKSIETCNSIESVELQQIFDNLYSDSLRNINFASLMDYIIREDNILLACKNVFSSIRDNTSGIDHITIRKISSMSCNDVVLTVRKILMPRNKHYLPKPTIRKMYENFDGTIRPIGIPCIWDRIIQQCIKQVLEPICEAKFSTYSYGFRPNRLAEHAISMTNFRLQRSRATHVIEIKIDNFYESVCHSKLIKQLWSIGIHDKHLIYIIKRILKGPIYYKKETISKKNGIVQTGILASLFGNIVLNEFDHWIESQWTKFPLVDKYVYYQSNGAKNVGVGYNKMRKKNLKEVYLVRYGEQIQLFCHKRSDAKRVLYATKDWFFKRLRLTLLSDETSIKNAKRANITFLGLRHKVFMRSKRETVKSHISVGQFAKFKKIFTYQARRIGLPRKHKTVADEIMLYNRLVLRFHNYYSLATNIAADCSILIRMVMKTLTNRLGVRGKNSRLDKNGNLLTPEEKQLYGTSLQKRYEKSTGMLIYPIGYIRHKIPKQNKRESTIYTDIGRQIIAKSSNSTYSHQLLHKLMTINQYNTSIQFIVNKLELFCDQNGKCAISGIKFARSKDVHCHHILPKKFGGNDDLSNLVLVHPLIHLLIHSTKQSTINKCIKYLKLDLKQINKVNYLRSMAKLSKI